jgi:catechol 2,3-dioxygenase-like lactoylglutathione lyase family enzyme
MMTLTSLDPDAEQESAGDSKGAVASRPSCYSVTIFTQRWREVRDFYVDILSAHVISERSERYCEMEVGGLPICIRKCEHGEMLSYFHLYIELKNRDAVLNELRRRGIIVTSVGPYTNFRDPEGRVIKLSEQKTVVS